MWWNRTCMLIFLYSSIECPFLDWFCSIIEFRFKRSRRNCFIIFSLPTVRLSNDMVKWLWKMTAWQVAHLSFNSLLLIVVDLLGKCAESLYSLEMLTTSFASVSFPSFFWKDENQARERVCYCFFSSYRYRAWMKRPRDILLSGDGLTKEDWRVQCEKRVSISMSETLAMRIKCWPSCWMLLLYCIYR